MLFTDPIFLFYFLPLALALHTFLAKLGAKGRYPAGAGLALFLLTLVFYGYGEPWWVVPFVFGVAFDFFWAACLSRAKQSRLRKCLVACSVLQNLALLFLFKYWHFATTNLAALFPSLAPKLPGLSLGNLPLALPAGISFYTFESLSYVIDVYRREVTPPKSPQEFFTFIAMFPRFIAGPIVRYRDLSRQFHAYAGPRLSDGLGLFVKGLFLKCCFADSFAVFTSYAFGRGSLDFRGAWVGSLAYTFQIYFDFFGYSLMAIGLGLCLGFRFPDNFDRPYFAENISDFWRRWHITLSTWLRDYVYISLGGSRCSPAKRYRNLFLTMALGGLWHGASWNFLVWGSYHGTLLCLEHGYGFSKRLPAGLRRPVNFLLVLIGWIPFRAASLREAFKILRSLFNPFSGREFVTEGLQINPVALALCIGGIAYLLLFERTHEESPVDLEPVFGASLRNQIWRSAQLLAAIVVALSAQVVPFLYFTF